MATINYSETQLKSGEKVITWSSVAPGDEGELYDLSGLEVLSIHVHKSSAGDVQVELRGGNANVGFAGFGVLQNFSADTFLVGLDGVTGVTGKKKPRYIAPKALSGSTGAISFYILAKEDR